MEILLVLIGLPLIIGLVVTVVERRKNKVFLKHDLSLRGPSTEAGREAERAAQAAREAQQRSFVERL